MFRDSGMLRVESMYLNAAKRLIGHVQPGNSLCLVCRAIVILSTYYIPWRTESFI